MDRGSEPQLKGGENKLGTKCVFQHQDLQKVGLRLNIIMSDCHPLEVVGRDSEIQLQVGEKYILFNLAV